MANTHETNFSHKTLGQLPANNQDRPHAVLGQSSPLTELYKVARCSHQTLGHQNNLIWSDVIQKIALTMIMKKINHVLSSARSITKIRLVPSCWIVLGLLFYVITAIMLWLSETLCSLFFVWAWLRKECNSFRRRDCLTFRDTFV